MPHLRPVLVLWSVSSWRVDLAVSAGACDDDGVDAQARRALEVLELGVGGLRQLGRGELADDQVVGPIGGQADGRRGLLGRVALCGGGLGNVGARSLLGFVGHIVLLRDARGS